MNRCAANRPQAERFEGTAGHGYYLPRRMRSTTVLRFLDMVD